MKLWTKIFIPSLIIVILIISGGIISINELQKIEYSIQEEIAIRIQNLNAAAQTNGHATFIRYYDEVLTQSARNYAFTGEEKWKERYDNTAPKLDETIKKAIQGGSLEQAQYFVNIDDANIKLVEMETRAIQHVKENNAKEGIEILESEEYWNQKRVYEKGLKDYSEHVGKEYDEILIVSTERIEEVIQQGKEKINQTKKIIIVIAVLTLIASMSLAIFITTKVSTPVRRLRETAKEISKGNFKQKASIQTKDELEELSKEIENMAKKLQKSQTDLQREVKKRTKELEKRIGELEDYEELTANRELRMTMLKKEVNELLKKEGSGEKYRIGKKEEKSLEEQEQHEN